MSFTTLLCYWFWWRYKENNDRNVFTQCCHLYPKRMTSHAKVPRKRRIDRNWISDEFLLRQVTIEKHIRRTFRMRTAFEMLIQWFDLMRVWRDICGAEFDFPPWESLQRKKSLRIHMFAIAFLSLTSFGGFPKIVEVSLSSFLEGLRLLFFAGSTRRRVISVSAASLCSTGFTIWILDSERLRSSRRLSAELTLLNFGVRLRSYRVGGRDSFSCCNA